MSCNKPLVISALSQLFPAIGLELDAGYQCDKIILGPTIHLTVDAKDLSACKTMLEATPYDFIYPDGSSIAFAMPLSLNPHAYWQQTRKDRMAQSGAISIRNAMPLASPDSSQAFLLTADSAPASSSTAVAPATTTITPDSAVFLETLVLFLGCSLLLTPDQMRDVLLDLLANSAHTQQWPLSFAGFTWRSPWGHSVAGAFAQSPFPFKNPVLRNMRRLQQVPLSFERDPAQRVFVEFEMARRDLFVTLVFTNPRPQLSPGINERCWSLAPPGTSSSVVHVVAIPQALAKQHGGILMTFSTSPTDNDILSILKLVQPQRKLALRFHTEPIRYSGLGLMSSLFRMDGQLNAQTASRTMKPRVTTAFRQKMSKKASIRQGSSSTLSVSSVTPQSTKPFTICILYIRVSSGVQEDAGATSERQFLSLLHRLSDFDEVMEQVEKIIVAVEYCSSSQHPWADRKLPQSIFGTEDRLLLLSINPDRVTRRSQEVPTIIQSLRRTGSEWWTLGAVNRVGTWVSVSAPAETKAIQDQLDLTRQVAVQQGLYTRSTNAVIRILNHLQPQAARTSPEMLRLQTVVANMCSPYQHVIAFARISPDFSSASSSSSGDSTSSPSTRRQRELLRQVLGMVHKDKVAYHELTGRSAFRDEAMQDLSNIISNLQGKVLVVSTTVDRVVRHEKHLSTLNSILILKGGQVASILWDPLNFDIKTSSQPAREWHSCYPPVPANALLQPVVVPDVWFDHSRGKWSSNVVSHVKAAQEFCEGFRLTMYQGDSKLTIPEELTATGIARGFNPNRAAIWEA
ncbi:hypothetical protein EC968_008381, partial [Mortierella alpina]